MIIGQFTRDDRPIIGLPLRNSDGEEVQIEAAIDTGFLGALFLPNRLVQRMRLQEIDRETVMLADGSLSRLPLHEVAVIWEGEARLVTAYGANGIALVGYELLKDHLGYIEFFDGGEVIIEPRD